MRRWLFSLIAGAFLATSCSQQAHPPVARTVPEGGFGMAKVAPGAPAPQADENKLAAPASEPQPVSPDARRYIVRRATVALLVDSIPSAMDRLRAQVKGTGGLVSDETVDTTEGQAPSASMTLRVPVARFEAALAAFDQLGKLQSRQVSGEDVTMEYTDTESRLRNLKREEDQLLLVLQRSGQVRDILAVEKELARVRGEIEQTTGRLRHLGNLVDLATITVNLTTREEQGANAMWDLGPVWRNAWHDAQAKLAGTVGALVTGLVWVAAYVLPLLIPGAILYLVLGWLANRLLVGRVSWLTRDRFRVIWGIVGVAVLVVIWPPLFVFLLVVGVLWFAWSKIPGLPGKSAPGFKSSPLPGGTEGGHPR